MHCREPKLLAEVFHFKQSAEQDIMNCKRMFNVGASLDYSEDEYIVLGAVWIEANLNEDEINKLHGLMRRMADWYESYLKWEDLSKEENKMFPWERKEKVTPRQQEILELKLQGYRHEQIAEKLGITVACVNALSSRGSKRIKKQIHLKRLGAA